ncbi:MAG: alpha/beta hydrolase [Gammaproteobacteria bacterium]|nr:alpha/beta hydrolase [Gammaproteobacteria bacterium]
MAAEHLLLLPGMMCDERLWESQIRDLPQAIQVPSLAGFENFPDMASSILDSAPEHFGIAGLSMGGILAFELWRQAPERITHLALIDTNPFADTPDRKSLRLQQIETVLNGGLRELAVEQLKPLYLAESHKNNDELLGAILDMAIDLGPEVFRTQSIALRDRTDSVATLADIDCPVSVICGAEDTLCPVDYHEYMAERISGATLVVINDCGHLASMEQPDIVTSELHRLFSAPQKSGNMHAIQ